MKQTGIVIVTYNSRGHLPRLFEALAATLPRERAVIAVIDNASDDGSAELAEESLKRLALPGFVVRNRTNLGFCDANNRGVYALRARHTVDSFLFLNPDTEPQAGWFEPLVEELDRPGVGSASSLLLLPDGRVNSLGNAMHFFGFGFTTGYGQAAPESGGDRETFFGTGAALAISTEALGTLRKASGRDEVFWSELFMYGEDQDLGWRLRLAGLSNRVCGRSRVLHHSSFIGDRPRSQGLLYLERNRWLLLLANFRLGTVLLLTPWLWALEFLQLLGWRRLYAGSRWRIYRSVWAEVLKPSFWSRRRCLQQRRVLSDRAILRCMDSSIRHGAMPRRPIDGMIDAVLAALKKILLFLVRW